MGNTQQQTQSQTQEYKLFMELQKQILHNQFAMQQEIHKISNNNNPFEQIKEQYKTIANCSSNVKHAFLVDILTKYGNLLTFEQINKIKNILHKLESQHQNSENTNNNYSNNFNNNQNSFNSFNSNNSYPNQNNMRNMHNMHNNQNNLNDTTYIEDNNYYGDINNINDGNENNTYANQNNYNKFQKKQKTNPKSNQDYNRKDEYIKSLESIKEDPLKLFGLTKNYTIDELKTAYKKMALKTHPDKCNGNDEKFKLVSKCYCKLLEDYKNREEYRPIEDMRQKAKEYMGKQTDTPTNPILEEFAGDKKFNVKKFNEVFEKNKIYDPNDEGYAEWYKAESDDAPTPDISGMFSKKFNLDLFNKTFNETNANATRDICEYNEPSALVSCNTMAHSALGVRVDNFTSSMNNKLGFTDLKNAYTVDNKFINPETVKKRKDYKNIDELVKERGNLSYVLTPEEEMRQRQREQLEEEQEMTRLRRQEEYDRISEEHYKRVSMAMLGVAKQPDLSR